MALISCHRCSSDDDIHLEGIAADGSRTLRCGKCGHTWSPIAVGNALPASSRTPFEMAKGRFATPEMVDPALASRVTRLKNQFLKAGATGDATGAAASGAAGAVTGRRAGDARDVDPLARWRDLFSAQGLAASTPEDLRAFVASPAVGNTANTSVFSRAWKRLGAEEAAGRVRSSVEFLLRGPADMPLEDRFTHLVDDPDATGMPGFKEALLTKVLCVVEPERFLPVLTYGAPETGKRDLALAVYGLHLPKGDATAMTVGRLAVWSNDLLLTLAGDGFSGPRQAADFLRWAVDRVRHTAAVAVR